MGSYFVPPANYFFKDIFVSNVGNIANVIFNNGNVTAAEGNGFFFGNGAFLTGVTAAVGNIPAVVTADIRGNIIGNYANVSNVTATFGNIANVLFNNGNVTAAYYFGNGSQLTDVTATLPSVVTADIRGNIIGNYANVSNVTATFGNIANVLFNNGNVTAAYYFGNGSQLTDVTATLPSVVTADIRGNIIGNYANVSNVTATFGNIANVLFNNGNVTAAYYFGNGSQLTDVTATLPSVVTADIRGNIIGNYANVSNVTATFGNIANVLFNNGNVTAAYYFGNGSQLTDVTATLPSVVTADIRGNIIGNYANVSNVTATFGNIANVLFNNGNVTAAYYFGNGSQLTDVTATLPSVVTADIRGNIIGNYANVSNVTATFGNIANVLFNNGNVTAAYYFGNGSQLTNVTATLPSVVTADIRGNIIGNYANVSNVTATFGNIANVLFNNGNVTAAYYFGNGSQLTNVTATLPSVVTADIRGNIIGNYANVSNVTATFGNIANVLFTNGNVTAAYYFGNGSQLTDVTATLPSVVTADIRGNIIGNYANVSNVSATFGNIANVLFNNGNVTAAYYFGNGSQLTNVTATLPSVVTADIRGNIIGNYANVSNVTATFGNIANVLFNNGNVTAAYYFGNGSQLTDVTATLPSVVTADIRGNIIGNYANVSNVTATFGNIANVLFNNGNVTAAYYFGNGSQLTDVTATLPSVVTADIRGNIIGNYANVSNVTATFGNIANVLFNNGNVTAAYYFGNGSQLTNVTATLPSVVTADIRGNIIGNYANVSNVTATFGNIANVLFTNGNVTAAYYFGNGSQLTDIASALPGVISEDIRGNIIGNYANVSNVTATFGNIANVLFNNGNVTAADGRGFLFGNGASLGGIVLALPSVIPRDIRGNIIGNYANVNNIIAASGNIANTIFTSGDIDTSGNIAVGPDGLFRGPTTPANNAIILRGIGGVNTTNLFSIGAPSGQMRFSVPSSATAFYNFLNGTDQVASLGPQGFLSRSFDASVIVGQVISSSSTYTGTILRTEANRNGSSAFNHIVCTGSDGNVFRVQGNGKTYGTGTFATSGADYAEMMEWEDKNINFEDRRGYPVVLSNNGKIRIASNSDNRNDIIGVVSCQSSILADVAWAHWEGKYLKDKFGLRLSNTIYYSANISNENEFSRVSPMYQPPQGYFIKTEVEYILNPKYNPSIPYIERTDRPEWDPVGFVGKLRVRNGCPVNPSWKPLKVFDDSADVGNINAQVVEYLIGVSTPSINELTDRITVLENQIRILLGNI
ncbi:pre-neck appendage protein [Only Syngen Nebraska virus 5]|uniref:pre-neck appendage protein n=1 Tax=Only Syngen Nebraska virus 5 TaxID=1917232 RepID=UPI00090116A4|nr:pre-neck appendage protein [Only Syngen Nebraska virus 5]APC25560.1 hypothetical protein [Only Syngen Nebraska virus 5]